MLMCDMVSVLCVWNPFLFTSYCSLSFPSVRILCCENCYAHCRLVSAVYVRFVTHALIAWQISEVVDVERMKGFEDAVMRVVNKHIQLGSCENNM